MKPHVSPTIVGAFVLGAFTLGILGMLFFGGVAFFHRPQRFVTYFGESIQGLGIGSPVKLQGVQIGRVVDLNIRFDPTRNSSVVEVVCQIERSKITDRTGREIDVTQSGEVEDLVSHGLRTQLGVVGLATGLLFVELDFLDPHQYPASVPFAATQYPVVPAVPSTISEFQASATDIMTRIKRIDFEGIGSDAKALIHDARAKVDGIDLAGLGAQWKSAGASVEALARSPQIKQTFDNLNARLADLHTTLEETRVVLAKADTQVDANGQELQATLRRAQGALQQFDRAASALRQFVDSQQNLGDDSHRALTQLADAAESVRRLADFLERNPSALVSGRKPPQ